MSHIIIGLNAFHADSAAALVIDGNLIVAAEEERFRRIKHWAGFPTEAIKFCLAEAGVSLAKVDAIAVNTDPSVARGKRLMYAIKKRPSIGLVVEKLKIRHARMGVSEHLKVAFPDAVFAGKILSIEHHLAHLASAFDLSSFDRALAVSIDGFGDFASGAFGVGAVSNGQTQLNIDGHVYFPHSLGIFYQAMTQYLGFMNYGDEYKVMGLAPYGKPLFVDQLRQLLTSQSDGSYMLNLDYFRHHRDSLNYQWDDGVPKFDALYSKELNTLLGPARVPGVALTQRDRDLAASVQTIYEESTFALLNGLHAKYKIDDLALAGGCAQNSVANGKITQRTPFKRIYVAASGADAGGAIGAALAGARSLGQARSKPFNHAYLGPQFSNSECEAAILAFTLDIGRERVAVSLVSDEAQLCDRVVKHIIQGHIVGWFQGRMEWGPRALGNRSILADPRRSDVQDILNAKIKRRESFRPFAPSILREYVSEWFVHDADVPFMAQVLPIRADRRAQIPAVTHVDGSGRLQTVTRLDNPRYYRLIDTFRGMTNVPILLNTSFNENEPVVCQPSEALSCFLRTKMDVLVLGDWLLERPNVD
jgi:carbamoyltransferase